VAIGIVGRVDSQVFIEQTSGGASKCVLDGWVGLQANILFNAVKVDACYEWFFVIQRGFGFNYRGKGQQAGFTQSF